MMVTEKTYITDCYLNQRPTCTCTCLPTSTPFIISKYEPNIVLHVRQINFLSQNLTALCSHYFESFARG